MIVPRPVLLLVFAALALGAATSRDALSPIAYHDNDRPAGRMVDGELRLAFSIVEGSWQVNGDESPGTRMLAFAGRDGRPMLPGPLIRVPVGTRLAVTVTNTTDSILVLRGISADSTDTLIVAPGATGTARGVAEAAGNRYYDVGYRGQPASSRRNDDGLLAGALVVDAPGARTATEHVLLITSSFHSRDSAGQLTRQRELFSINGRSWPRTKRYTGTVGDTLRFRVINASEDGHPMHLHGSFFRVEARGDAFRDTVRAPAEQRMVVTEYMTPGTTMTMAWAPDRPGGWLMHCHLTFHTTSNVGFGSDSLSAAEQFQQVLNGHGHSNPDNHVVEGMGGLMTSIDVAVPANWSLRQVARRSLRFEIPDDSMPGMPAPRYAPTIRDGDHVELPLHPLGPGGVLLLHQDEPTAIRVVNGSTAHTSIHWHGMELESYFDGVVGIGGTPDRRSTAVAPRDSFMAYMTPPRAGTFIYHTHMFEVKQGAFGLFGAMIVLPRGQTWDPTTDHYFIAGSRVTGATMNGDSLHPPMRWAAGSEHRLRLINITAANAGLRYAVYKGDGEELAQWTHIAKDGWDLPPQMQARTEAFQRVSMGETYDMRVRLDEPGSYRLVLIAGRATIISTQPIVVTR